MKFCIQCDNMYYLGINEENTNELIYYCRNCKHVDNTLSSEGACILDTYNQNSELQINHIINKYTKSDPTLPRMNNMKCPNAECKSNKDSNDKFPEVIYMRFDDANMKYVYICNECDFVWKTNTAV